MASYILGVVKAVVYGRPKQSSTRPSYKQPLTATPSTSPGKLDPKLGSNPDRELDRNHDSELDRNHDGEASKESIVSLERENHMLQHQLNMVAAEREGYMFEVNRLDKALRNEISERASAEREMQAVMKKISSLKERNAHLDSENKKVQGKLDSSIMDLRKAQLSSFKQAQTGWFVEEDSKIHDALTQFYKDVRLWAKAYGVKSLKKEFGSFPPDDLKHINNALSRVAVFHSGDDFLGFKHPFLILAALVSDVLSTFIFDDYFWPFRHPGGPDDDDDGLWADVLEGTFSKFCSSSATDAHTWRALLFRAVFPKSESPELRVWDEFPANHSTNFVDCVVGKIVNGVTSAFLRTMEKTEEQRCYGELTDLISRALKLFSRLQTQRAGYVWHKPSDFISAGFDVQSPKVAADRLVKLEDDEDDSCNGKKIKLVVSPAVQKYGDSNGENYHSGRFLAKAVVFLES